MHVNFKNKILAKPFKALLFWPKLPQGRHKSKTTTKQDAPNVIHFVSGCLDNKERLIILPRGKNYFKISGIFQPKPWTQLSEKFTQARLGCVRFVH